MNGGSIYEWEFDGTGDLMAVTGNLTLNDAWVLKLVDLGDDPQVSEKYDLFTFTGNFNGSAVIGPITLLLDANYTLDANSALDWDVDDIDVVVEPATTGFRVYVTGIGLSVLPGDADDNGVVNAADYIVLKTNMGQATGATTADGDFDDDGDVDWADLQILQTHYGETIAASGTIPEPATLGLLAIGALAAIRRRQGFGGQVRRRRRS